MHTNSGGAERTPRTALCPLDPQLFRTDTAGACTRIPTRPSEAGSLCLYPRSRIPEGIAPAAGLRKARVPDDDSVGARAVAASAFLSSFPSSYLLLRSA